MLTADMVRARRRGDTLTLTPLVPTGPKGELVRAELMQLAEDTLDALRAHVGHCRDDVDAALGGLVVRAALKKVAAGLAKLALDACEFSADAGDEARALRAEVFGAAAAARMAATSQRDFSVQDTVRAAAERVGCSVDDLMTRLYADLRGQHVLLRAPGFGAARLLSDYELGQAQAVLLRATSVRVVVSDTHAPTLRYLFQKLKFHGLLFEIAPLASAGAGSDGTAPAQPTRYAITLDGPLSLFQASTKYGLALALVLLAADEAVILDACDGSTPFVVKREELVEYRKFNPSI